MATKDNLFIEMMSLPTDENKRLALRLDYLPMETQP